MTQSAHAAHNKRPGSRYSLTRYSFFCLPLLCILFAAMLSACMGELKQPLAEKKTFAPGMEYTPSKVFALKKGICSVGKLTLSPTFDRAGLVYRTGKNEYEVDYYNRFLIPAQDMLSQTVYTAIASSGIFAHVPLTNSSLRSAYRLEGRLVALYGDYQDIFSSYGVVEAQFFLLHDAGLDYEVLTSSSYRESIKMDGRSPEALVTALDTGFARILDALLEDLAETMQD